MTEATTPVAFFQGEDAAREGKKINRNPYSEAKQTLLWGAWRNGWATYMHEKQMAQHRLRQRMRDNPIRIRTRS